MKKFARLLRLGAALAATILLVSCIGVDISAKIEASGSGSMSVEYRIAEAFVSFGQQESDPGLPLPLSKSEIEQSLQNHKGLSLTSYEMKKSGTDTIISFKIAFDSPERLAAYLDSEGKLARYESIGGISKLTLSTGDILPPMDSQTKTAFQDSLKPYRFRFAFESASGAPEATIVDGNYFSRKIEGKKAIIEASIADILLSEKPAEIEFRWK